MNTHNRLARIAAGCAAFVLIGWSARSAFDGGAEMFSNTISSSNYKDVFQSFAHTHPHATNPSEAGASTSDIGASLGINGRPTVPPQTTVQAHYPEAIEDGSHLSDSLIEDIVTSIFNPGNVKFYRMGCPGEAEPGPRYEVLRQGDNPERKIKYLFALDLYECARLLPRLMGSIIQVIKYLGPENCGLSIIEGRSHDGTYRILHDMHEELQALGVRYWLDQSNIDPHGENVDRIAELSKLRNMALAPSWKSPELFVENPMIAFVNDIAVCPDDILEMLYQHTLQNATQTCAMDWTAGGNVFYDVWVSRTMSGNIFFEIPQDMSWAFSDNMFWDEPVAKEKYNSWQPFQVFSCWGGMVVLDGFPFIHQDLRFRRNVEGECYGGEPQTLASDLMKLGSNKVQTVPYISVAYSDHEGGLVKKKRGYTHEHVNTGQEVLKFEDDKATKRIMWKAPPPRYRCMPSFVDQWWVDSVYAPEEE